MRLEIESTTVTTNQKTVIDMHRIKSKEPKHTTKENQQPMKEKEMKGSEKH